MVKEKIIDVDYTEEEVKIITDELDRNKVYYTTGQVAKMLNITESKLRYWTNFFAADDEGRDLIKVEYSNKNRAYTLDNIDKLKKMQKLVEEDGMSLQQAKDYTTLQGFDTNNKAIKSDNPLALQAFVRELTSEIDDKLKNFEDNLIQKVLLAIDEKNSQMIQNEERRNQALKQEIAILTSETVSESINKVVEENLSEVSMDILSNLDEQKKSQDNLKESLSKEFRDYADKQEEKMNELLSIQKEEAQKQIQIFEELKLKMDQRKKENEEKSNKNFITRFFKK